MTYMMGHNGPPIETAADLPADMPKMHFFKLDIQAFRKAIFDKPLDIRGAYISVLLALYEHMEPLPANDAMAMLRCGIKDARIWRRVKTTLIELGLIVEKSSGRLSNPRFESEITIYVTEFRNRQRAAFDREEKLRLARATKTRSQSRKPDLGDSYGLVSPELSDSYGLANAQLSPKYPAANAELTPRDAKKDNEINAGPTTVLPELRPQANHESRIRARVLELDSNKEVSNTSHTQTEVAAAQGAREGEDDIGFGVYVNGKSIRHAAFAINLDGIRMQTLASGLTKEQTIEICKGHALQWAVEIENGKRPGDVVPSKIANFLSSSIIATANRGAQQSVRVARANRGYAVTDPDKPIETTAERWARMAKTAIKPGERT